MPCIIKYPCGEQHLIAETNCGLQQEMQRQSSPVGVRTHDNLDSLGASSIFPRTDSAEFGLVRSRPTRL